MTARNATRRHRGADPYRLYLGIQFCSAAFFGMLMVAASLYEATVAHLMGWQLVLVGTALEATILLFEVPTGVVADAYSRRLSIVLGFGLMGAGFIIEGSFPRFIPILAAQVVWGVGYTFTSGATQAWLSDEIGEQRANQAFLTGSQYDLAGALLGMLLAIPLGIVSIQAPILVGGGGFVALAGMLAWVMPEGGFRRTALEEHNSFQHMLSIAREGLKVARQRPALLAVLGVGLTYGVYSEGWDRLWVKYLIDHFTLPAPLGLNEVGFIGLLRAAGLLLSLIATRVLAKRLDANHVPSIARTMSWTTLLLAAAIFTFAFSPWLALSVTAIWLVSVSRNVISPLHDAWINQHLDPRTRATVISLSGQVDALGQIASGPIAAMISLWSIRAAIAGAGLLLAPAFPLIGRADRLHAHESASSLGGGPVSD